MKEAGQARYLFAASIASRALAGGGSLQAGWLILPGQGYTPAHGYPDLSLADPTMLRATAGAVLYLALIALLSLGIPPPSATPRPPSGPCSAC